MSAQEMLLGCLVGLANAATGNAWKAEEQTHALVRESLRLLARRAGEEELRRQADAVRGEKARLAPDCAACKNPCGRNADWDAAQMQDESDGQNAVKGLIVAALCAAQPEEGDTELLYRALRALGDEWTAERLLPLALQTGELALRALR
ncbi:MAG: hypothetical protein Q4A66_05425 [Eubacteriales bacterium]|nr:hypothetical protein [Eubacteriales bacterium]